ncbi:type II toxin-antitoxin system VapC family toxin [Sphingomonas sp. S1-29]|uniref:type II toxin-antitoxin system VapC family toxin n=1 Tax=Sphingomonas sp. S1-29 TaxID=2991074 RepID=UPI00223EA61E|nr:type II toxin-antitoxin system VapC family toxin [Sphingomonas sp. S1-29]UZK69841.1 type II toxin-antitoxin system VapC family toxin [Sphingomonas sp. S1-29]
MLVIDASVAVKWLVEEPGSEAAEKILGDPRALVAPDWIVAEVANALLNKVARGEMTAGDASEGVETLPRFFHDLYPAERHIASAMQLALTLQHAFYDCLYLALAIDVGAILVTADKRFADAVRQAARGHPLQLLDEV